MTLPSQVRGMRTHSSKQATASHRDLDVWNLAMDLVLAIYSTTKALPTDERFGLTSQLRRAAVSIPANIAEGHGRRGAGEFHRFVSIAKGSICELDTELELAERLDYVNPSTTVEMRELMNRVGRMLTNLAKSLRD